MKISMFQLIVLCIFGALVLLGVAAFATIGGLTGGGKVGKVIVWGTLDSTVMEQVLAGLRQQGKQYSDVEYVQRDPATYTTDLINAMASGTGPDLILLPQDELYAFRDKIMTIPYSAMSQSAYTSAYIDEARLFLTTQGIEALPLSVDPMVMYWNRDLLASAGIAQPPQYWNDFLALAPRVTVLGSGSTVTRSGVALGEWNNVTYAKDILAALFMQAGDPIVSRNSTGAAMVAFGQTPAGATENPAASALQFYTEFANPSKTSYSWNRTLPSSQDAFVAGDLAVYFGRASDYQAIVSRNPNLHFSVSMLPQVQGAGTTLTFGQMLAVAIPRTSANQSGALLAAQALTNQQGISAVVAATNLPPVRRDVTVDTSANAAASTFNQAALIAHAWLDPDPTKTDDIFKSMIESVVSGASQPYQAVSDAQQSLQALIPYNTTATQ